MNVCNKKKTPSHMMSLLINLAWRFGGQNLVTTFAHSRILLKGRVQ